MDDVLRAIDEAHNRREYRPVAVAVIFGGQNGSSVLCVRSAKNPDDWGFVQGGIEAGEDPVHALRREITEEVGIPAENLGVPYYIGRRDLDAEPGRVDKRGYTKGKRYFFFAVRCTGDPPFLIDRREISEARWTKPEDVPTLFAATRESRRLMLIDLLSPALLSPARR